MIDIVLTCWGREWMTKLTIEALKKNTTTPFRLITIDNGSSGIYQPFIEQNSDIYVKLDRNYGLEHAKHLGMQFVESELFVSTDNDILVYKYPDKDWLAQLIDLMKENPGYGAIALRPQVLVGTNYVHTFSSGDPVVRFPHVPGYMRIMRTDLVKATGAWNEKSPLRGHEEMWIGNKFKEYGWDMGWASEVRCWHLFGKEDTDMWGYAKDSDPATHGHNPVWPIPQNDKDEILEMTGVEI